MFRFLPVFLAATLLTSCAYTTEKSHQTLTVLTPGAHGAKCNVYVDGLRYEFYAPETRNIFKSQEDLVVDCIAPGNRRKKVVIEPSISSATSWNVANALAPGLLVDYASGAMFRYPEVVEINFTDMEPRSAPLPAQNNPDIRQPEDYDLEEFSPGSPRMNSDRYQKPITPRRRQPGGGFGIEDAYQDSATSAGAGFLPPTSNDYTTGGKGDLMPVRQSSQPASAPDAVLNDVAAPAVSSAPVPASDGSAPEMSSENGPIILSPQSSADTVVPFPADPSNDDNE